MQRDGLMTDRALLLLEDKLDSIERRLVALAEDRSKVAELWLTKKELAQALGVSVRWIEQRMAEGLPHREIAGKRVFQLTASEAWLRRRGHLKEIA
jgi:hypothetical protein